MAGDDDGGVGQGEEGGADGAEEGGAVATGQVGATDGAGEESVAGEEKIFVRQVEADAALSVARGVEDGAGEAGAVEFRVDADGDDAAVFEGVVGLRDLRGGDAEPSSLEAHHLDQREIARVVEDGRAGERLEAGGAGDMVDVGVSDEDLGEGEFVAGQDGDDTGDVVAGIDYDGLARDLIAEDGAVALQHADGEDLMDHERG